MTLCRTLLRRNITIGRVTAADSTGSIASATRGEKSTKGALYLDLVSPVFVESAKLNRVKLGVLTHLFSAL